MKKMLYILPVAFAMMMTGCKDFLDVNTSKDAPITITVDQAIPTACFYAAQICYDHSEYGVYLSQALTTGSNSQTGSYPYSQGWEFLGVNRHPMWRRHFYDLGANIHKMNEIADKEGKKNAILIGRTIMLQSTMLTTDAFGDMPRSQAYTATSPQYDSQADIYDWMFEEADELVKLYEDTAWTKCPTNLPLTKKMDRIYAGDMAKWALYAKALRCRLWLRKLPNWDNTSSTCQKIISMVDEVLNDPNWTEPLYRYDGGTTEQNCPWGPSRPKINAWESRDNRLVSSMPSTFFAKAILGAYVTKKTNSGYALDMRADYMMKPSNKSGKDALLYLENNLGMEVSAKQNFYPDLYAAESATNPYTLDNGYIALITTEELMFIKAEAQYWMGDKAGAFRTTRDATICNMQRYGVYESNYSSAKQKERYDLFFEVKFPGEALFTIADLMQQKYVAMYLQPEQWTDMRRYNYSSKANGIQYDNCYVYTVTRVHDGSGKDAKADKFTHEYSLHRPYNLYQAYWCTPDDYGISAELSPNAWINRLNADTETETKYNKGELDRIGYYTEDASGNKILDYRILKHRLIWAHNTCGKATCSDPTPWQ
ncbi:MAG: SusD/RagB family nutrient-binding outer membrane lipoprotein [Paludibacteraceae bacterium]|nr:SusD/RagB family nutrient-binding outer membrane lipoprotein [Paludibacteraceae bacterium]